MKELVRLTLLSKSSVTTAIWRFVSKPRIYSLRLMEYDLLSARLHELWSWIEGQQKKEKNDETQVSGLLGNFLLLIKEPMKNEFVVESRTV